MVLLGLLEQQALKCFVKKELLAEVVKLFADELVQGAHHRLQDAHAVGADGEVHLIDADGLDLFRRPCVLNENLLVQVVVIHLHELLRLSKQDHDVNSLLELLRWEVRWQDADA